MNIPEAYVRNFMDTGLSCRERLSALWGIIVDQYREWRKTKGYKEEADLLLRLLWFLWKHAVLILMVLMPVILLWVMDQGKDLILNLFFSRGAGISLQDYIRILWLLGMLVLQAYAIWVIPNFFIRSEVKRKSYMDGLLAKGLTAEELPEGGTISMSSDFLRLLAIAPISLYGITFAVRMDIQTDPSVWYWVVNMVIGFGLLLAGICLGYGLKRIRDVLILGGVILLLIPVAFAVTLGIFPEHQEWAYAILGNSLFIGEVLLFAVFHRWERRFTQVDDRESNRMSWMAGQVYRLVFLAVGLVAAGLMFWPNTMRMATIPVLVFFVAAYILLLNLITYRVKLFDPMQKFLVFLGVVALLVIAYQRPSKGHYVYLVDKKSELPRPAYADYQSEWLAGRIGQDSVCAPVIYLVAGEGGGSRAAYWTSNLLSRLDAMSGYRFAHRVFALSTVSGSSAGTSAWYKLLRFADTRGLTPAQQDTINRRFSQRTFGHNFVTGSIIDVLTRDFFKMFQLGIWRSDRNLRLQEEENYGFLFGLGRRNLGISQTYRLGSAGVDSLRMPGDSALTIPNWHFTGLPDLYLRPDGRPETRWPLLLFNTTHMQTGRRGIVSPVALDDRVFFDAIDVIGRLDATGKRRTAGKTIALGTANNMSECFPLFSAFSYVDGVGNFMDGGAYENKGLTTILDVYAALRAQLDTLCPDARIVVLAMENGTPSNSTYTAPIHQSPAMLLQASSQPFTSQTEAAKKRAIRTFGPDNPDRLLWMSLGDYPASATIPLARDLAQSSMRAMDSLARLEVRATLEDLKVLDPDLFGR